MLLRLQSLQLICSGKVVTFQESLFACKRKLSKTSRLLRRAATGNCPDRLGLVIARLTTAITCDTDVPNPSPGSDHPPPPPPVFELKSKMLPIPS